jgi:N-acetylglucosamine-6-phosphate deacetylase
VLVSIGHTNANSQQIAAAVEAGARLSTHLGNGAHARIQRHPNYIWDQLSHDQLTASLIVDGFHLPPSVVKAMVRAKTPDRVVLISDMTGLAGSIPAQPGRYEHPGLGAVEVLPDGRVVVAGQQDYLAGATLPLSTGIARVMEYAGVDLEIAVNMASLHPARLLQLDDCALERGAVADLIECTLTDQGAFEVLATFRAGECVWRKE